MLELVYYPDDDHDSYQSYELNLIFTVDMFGKVSFIFMRYRMDGMPKAIKSNIRDDLEVFYEENKFYDLDNNKMMQQCEEWDPGLYVFEGRYFFQPGEDVNGDFHEGDSYFKGVPRSAVKEDFF